MKLPQLVQLGAISLLVSSFSTFAQTAPTTEASSWNAERRNTLAIRYPDQEGTSVDMIGTARHPRVRGKAEVKRRDGRTSIKIRLDDLAYPQVLGSDFTTYVVWAIAPEGQADNLGELPIKRNRNSSDISVTTPYQTFGLIVTAEPYGLVKMPSPNIVAENILREKTKGTFTASQIEYRGDTGSYYSATSVNNSTPVDYDTPLVVLGAQRAVEIARRANATRFAETELRQAETQLATLEKIWPNQRTKEERFSSEAREVMRFAEQARTLAVQRSAQARLEAERRAASNAVSSALSDAERARNEAERARLETERARSEAENSRAALSRSENELAAARQRAEQAQTEAEKAKANEEVARLQADRSRLESEQAKQESEQAKRERDAAQQRLFVSLSAILDTRREARGLIVNLSDVLFDFNQATLKPGAREKLSKLVGILLAYPGNYSIEIEGHTDAVGSDEYNQKLSENRASAVRDYIAQAGLAADRIKATRGFGKTRPVATNDTDTGRQQNRRVEIVIGETESTPAVSHR